MPILLECTCGKKLKVRDELAGKKVKCPACGGVVVVSSSDVTEVIPAPRPSTLPPPLPGGKTGPPRPAAQESDDTPIDEPPFYRECLREFTRGLLVLGADAIWFGRLKDDELEQAKRALDDGEPVEEALNEEAAKSRIEFADIVEVNFNKHHKELQVQVPGAEKNEKENHNFHFDSHEERDDAFKELRRRLGRDWIYKRRDLNAFQAALAPLGTIAVVIAVFAFFVFLAWAFQQPAEGGGPRVIRTTIWGILVMYTVGWLGPIWTGVLGGVIVVGCIVWMIIRMATPPIEITLKPPPKEDDAEEEERPPRKKRRRDEDED